MLAGKCLKRWSNDAVLAGKCLKRWSNDAVLSGKSVPPQFFFAPPPSPPPLQIKLGGPIAVNCSEIIYYYRNVSFKDINVHCYMPCFTFHVAYFSVRRPQCHESSQLFLPVFLQWEDLQQLHDECSWDNDSVESIRLPSKQHQPDVDCLSFNGEGLD